jgi:hypothetical protein
MRPRVPLEVRFWQFVPNRPESGCWPWVGAVQSGKGYPVLTAGGRNGKRVLAKRLAFEIQNGPIPEGHEVFQACGNKRCVRGDHLEALTHSELMRRTMKRDGKWAPSGEDNHRAKLSSAQVAQLRHLAIRGAKTRDLVAITGMSESGVRRIVTGESRASG